MTKKKETKTATVTDIGDARKKRDAQQVEDLPLELTPPQALKIQGNDWIIRACDGEYEYVWIATMKKKFYKVIEVYPGLKHRDTYLREATELKDLELVIKCTDISDVVSALDDNLHEGLEECEEGEGN